MDVVLTGIEPEVKPELEGTSYRTTPAASAGEQTPDTQGSWDQGQVLVQKFKKRCKFDPSARLRFYMDCGRLHTDADHFHKPKNPKEPLKVPQLESLRIWFEQLPNSACFVMNHAIANWPRLYAEIPKWRGFRNKTPTISALEKYGAKELLDSWKAAQGQLALNRVAQNVAPITDDYYQQSDCNQLQISEVS